MKEWNNPEVWELGVEMTASQLGKKGNDQFLHDIIEGPIEHIFGKDIFGENS